MLNSTLVESFSGANSEKLNLFLEALQKMKKA